MSTITEKATIRKDMLDMRNNLDITFKKKYDSEMCASLMDFISTKNIKVVHGYLSMDSEINFWPLYAELLKKGITVVCPQVLPKKVMHHLILHTLKEVESGPFGTVHPIGHHVYEGGYDMILVPGLAFDKQGFRIGYGGGFYDRFLNDKEDVMTIGACYPFQVIDNMPRESYDIPVKKIWTV